MKIIYCITKADNGGAQTHLIQLANHFCVHNDVYVIVGNHGPMIEQLDARVNVIIIEHLVGPIDFKQDILAVKVLAQLFSKIKCYPFTFFQSWNGRTNCEVHFEIERHTYSFYCTWMGFYRGC